MLLLTDLAKKAIYLKLSTYVYLKGFGKFSTDNCLSKQQYYDSKTK